jgi:hypothetical protein
MKREVLQPSSGTTVIVAIEDLGDAWTAALAPDYFSIPMRNRDTAVLDPADSNRELVPGEIFIRVPLLCCNKATDTRSIDAKIERADGTTCVLVQGMKVPAGETAVITVQGQFLIQLVSSTVPPADTLFLKADVAGAFDVSGAGLLTIHAQDTADPNV